MVLIFWQGIISIHQKTFLEQVAVQQGITKVMLVVEQDITPYRKSMGWDVPRINGVEVVVAPGADEIQNIVKDNRDAVHIMGGIRVGMMLATAFDACARHKCRMGIMTEPYDDAGYKGTLRTLKYKYYRMRYVRHIQFVLAIGRQAVRQYSALGFDSRQVFPWAYFIDIAQQPRDQTTDEQIRRIIYAGRLEPAKGIYNFAKELVAAGKDNYTLDIYGEGPDEDALKTLVKDKTAGTKIKFHPFLKHDDLVKQYGRYDWVVLPSAGKDGWGVIVSEGLMNGLKAICSSKCGASWAVQSGMNGLVFDWAQPQSCRTAITELLTRDSFASPATISNHALHTLSANAGAAYFMQVLNCIYDQKTRPGIPWEQPIK